MLHESARLSIHRGRLTLQRLTASRPIDRYANVYLKDFAILRSSVSEFRDALVAPHFISLKNCSLDFNAAVQYLLSVIFFPVTHTNSHVKQESKKDDTRWSSFDID